MLIRSISGNIYNSNNISRCVRDSITENYIVYFSDGTYDIFSENMINSLHNMDNISEDYTFRNIRNTQNLNE